MGDWEMVGWEIVGWGMVDWVLGWVVGCDGAAVVVDPPSVG